MNVENSSYSAGTEHIGPLVSDFFPVSFFVDHFKTYSSPCFGCAIFLLHHLVENLVLSSLSSDPHMS